VYEQTGLIFIQYCMANAIETAACATQTEVT